MTEAERVRANDLAIQIALAEMVRFLIGELCYSSDAAEFKRNMNKAEAVLVGSLSSRTLWDKAKPEDEIYIRETASGYITRLLSTIRHPSETPQK